MHFDPILLDIAEQIDTERLVLRAVMPGDGTLHFPAVQESLQDLRRYLAHLTWVKEEPSLASSERHCRERRANFIKRESLSYFIFSKADHGFIGSISLLRIDWTVPRFEIGYWCRTGAQGKGYIVEAVHALTGFAFDKLAARRVEIRADDANVNSWKVAEAAGFVLEGVLRNWDRGGLDGGLADMRVYAKIAAEIS
ncbi:RimJ/RimL family protein N-acetyltransferase [Oxalobacteraceae bacterium GrIS 2.11]